MSDTQKSKAFSGLRETFSNPKARKGILLTAAVAGVVVVITGMSLRSKSVAPSIATGAQLVAPPMVRADVTADVTPQFRQMVVAKDGERATAAAKSELDMALPQVAGLATIRSEPVRAVVAAPVSMAPQAPAPAPAAAPTANAAATAQLTAQSDMQSRAQMEQQIRANPAYQVAGAFMASAAQQITYAKNAPFNVILAPQVIAKPGGSGESSVAQTKTAADSVVAVVTPAVVIIGAGQALFSTMDTAINSDYSGPVVATVRQGKYAGAKVIGTKALEYDGVVLKFNVMALPNGGPAIPIQAYAINLGDISNFGTTGLQGGSTDYHAMERYVLPAIMAFGQTYGYAASMNGTSSTTTQTSTTQSTTPLSSADRTLVALGGALAPLASDLTKRAARPITRKLDADTEVGILFTQDVTDKNAQAAAEKSAQGVNAGLPVNSAPVIATPSTAPNGGTSGVIATRTTAGFGSAPATSGYAAPYKPVYPQ